MVRRIGPNRMLPESGREIVQEELGVDEVGGVRCGHTLEGVGLEKNSISEWAKHRD